MLLKLAVLLVVIFLVVTSLRRSKPPPGGSPTVRGQMSTAEAARVLGIGTDAKREEVLEAHRRLIRSVHPDRGGSDYLAKQINAARDTLLRNAKAR